MKKTKLIIATLFAVLSLTTFVSNACANCNCPSGTCDGGTGESAPAGSEETNQPSS